jgi:hypothetical protein
VVHLVAFLSNHVPRDIAAWWNSSNLSRPRRDRGETHQPRSLSPQGVCQSVLAYSVSLLLEQPAGRRLLLSRWGFGTQEYHKAWCTRELFRHFIKQNKESGRPVENLQAAFAALTGSNERYIDPDSEEGKEITKLISDAN